MLETENLSAGYGDTPVLRGVSCEVRLGEVVAVLGPNGAGKTTLLRAMSGLIPATSGSIRLEGQVISGLSAHMVARAGMAHVLDSRGVLSSLDVRENILLGLASNRSKRQALASALESALHVFPSLEAKLNVSGKSLSGGQQQMVALARAMVTNPKVLLLDEPSQGLSPLLVDEVFQRIKEMAGSDRAILISEQFIHKALSISDRAYVLQRGRIVATDEAATLNQGGRVEQLYFA